ncbi:hypothetical protein ACLOJK_033466 [Asimina triloba]
MRGSGTAMAWNVFKFCSVLRGLGSVMILLVAAIVGVSYYAIVVTNYGPALIRGGIDTVIALCVLIPFHGLLVMLLWSYFSVVLTEPGAVPPNWKPATDEEIGETAPLTSLEVDGSIASVSPDLAQRGIRYCRKCNQIKPPRCHHCSVFLDLSYVEAAKLNAWVGPLPYVHVSHDEIVETLEGGNLNARPGFDFLNMARCLWNLECSILMYVLNLAFTLSVLGFLIMHISLVMANTTTIEAYEKKTTPKWRYDIGRRKNFEQVFGADRKYWFIPGYSEEDLRNMPVLRGLEYPSRPDAGAHAQEL